MSIGKFGFNGNHLESFLEQSAQPFCRALTLRVDLVADRLLCPRWPYLFTSGTNFGSAVVPSIVKGMPSPLLPSLRPDLCVPPAPLPPPSSATILKFSATDGLTVPAPVSAICAVRLRFCRSAPPLGNERA